MAQLSTLITVSAPALSTPARRSMLASCRNHIEDEASSNVHVRLYWAISERSNTSTVVAPQETESPPKL